MIDIEHQCKKRNVKVHKWLFKKKNIDNKAPSPTQLFIRVFSYDADLRAAMVKCQKGITNELFYLSYATKIFPLF